MDKKSFAEKYKFHPTRLDAISKFKNSTKFPNKNAVNNYIYRVMATIGEELERKFPSTVTFGNNRFKLFGREKSEKSTNDKISHNLVNYNKAFYDALKEGKDDELPSEVGPVLDLYGFKLVCPETRQPEVIINTVLSDILNDISKKHPEHREKVTEILENIAVSRFVAIDFIDNYYSEEYCGIKDKLLAVMNNQKKAEEIKSYLDHSRYDISTMTYSDYYEKIIECIQCMIDLSYDESLDEYVRIANIGLEAKERWHDAIENGTNKQTISKNLQEEYDNNIRKLLEHISYKRTNKVDLALGDLMILDVLTTSDSLRKLGVKVSTDPTRTKKKRTPNGYIANFYSLDMPNGLKGEVQLQSLYRYEYGELGPAAHNKMDNGRKKRTIYKPEGDFDKWAKKQFKSLPKFFEYIGHGFIQVYNTLQNFKRYYRTEDPEQVQAYASYIAKHDVDQFNYKIIRPNDIHDTHGDNR